MEAVTFTLKELCQAAGVTERTVRFYIKEGLLPPPVGPKAFSRYGFDHWLRLTVIRQLKEKYLPLREIKNLLEGMSTEQLAALAQRSGLIEATEAKEPMAEPTPGSKEALLESLLRPGPITAHAQTEEPDEDNPEAATGSEELYPQLPFAPEHPSLAERPLGFGAPIVKPLPGVSGGVTLPPSMSIGGIKDRTGFTMRRGLYPPVTRPPIIDETEEPASEKWERITIAPGIELNVESNVAERNRAKINALLKELRRLLDE